MTRVIFSGKAKASHALSLNYILQVVLNVQQDMHSFVLRFRTHNMCLTADIAKSTGRLTYTHKRAIYKDFYGDICLMNPSKNTTSYLNKWSIFSSMSGSTLPKEIIRRQQVSITKGRSSVEQWFYVDDLTSGTSSTEDVIKLRHEISFMLLTAGFTLRKWASNHSTFLGIIWRELQETYQK